MERRQTVTRLNKGRLSVKGSEGDRREEGRGEKGERREGGQREQMREERVVGGKRKSRCR